MTKESINRTRPILFVATFAVAFIVTGCGNEEDFYLDPRPPTSTHSSFQHNSELATQDSIIGDGNVKYQFERYPTLDSIHPYKLDKALGPDSLIPDPDEISPRKYDLLEELPAPDYWHPEDGQDDSSSEAPLIEHDFTPVATPFNKTKPFDQLTEREFGLVCKALDQVYDSQDLEALNVGDCTHNIAEQIFDSTSFDGNACGRYLDSCLAQRPHFELPIGLCDERSQPPESCEVNYAQLQSCIQAVNTTQTALGEEDICNTASDDINRTRVLLAQHTEASKCLTKLASNCEAIAPHDDE